MSIPLPDISPPSELNDTDDCSPLPVPEFDFGFQKRRVNKRVPPTPRKQRQIRAPSPLFPFPFTNSPLTPTRTSDQFDQYFGEAFEEVQMIGEGSFSKVYRAKHKQENSEWAIKVLQQPLSPSRLASAAAEFSLVQSFRSPHLLRYIFAWVERHLLHLQTPLFASQTLNHLLTPKAEGEINYFEEEVIWEWITDIALGLNELHSANLLHMDLKPSNIFLSSPFEPFLPIPLLVIGDFGLLTQNTSTPPVCYSFSSSISSTQGKRRKGKGKGSINSFSFTSNSLSCEPSSICNKRSKEVEEGDSKYISEEALRGEISEKSDIFSFGMSIFELMINEYELPTDGKEWEKLRSGNVTELSIFPKGVYSDDLRELIERMLHPSPALRPTTRDILLLPAVSCILYRRFAKSPATYLSALPPFIVDLYSSTCRKRDRVWDTFSVSFESYFSPKSDSLKQFSESSSPSVRPLTSSSPSIPRTRPSIRSKLDFDID